MPETENRICKKKLSTSRILTFRGSFGHLFFLLLLAVGLVLSSCSGGKEAEVSPQSRQLMSQIELSCQQMGRYTKTFQDAKAPEKKAEEAIMDTNADSLKARLRQDLAYLFDVYYQDEGFKGLLDTSFVGDTLIARVKKGKEKRSKLCEQKILKDGQGNFLYISTKTRTSNWLYSLDISIRAAFDSLGRYQRHRLYLQNKVHYLNERIESLIVGEASYQP